MGQTDETHGHLRPGYTSDDIHGLLGKEFTIISVKTYSKFFSECIDTLMTLAFHLLKRGNQTSAKGVMVTGKDLQQHQKVFMIYSIIYPIVWMFSKLDNLLFFVSGYMLLVTAKSNKELSK